MKSTCLRSPRDRLFLNLATIDWRMEAKGVTPIPVATRTACSAEKMVEEGALWGPSM